MSRELRPDPALSMQTLNGLTGYHLRRASRVVQDDLGRTLKPLGLRMITFSALTIIAENPGLSQSRLARALEIERPNMVTIVDQLEKSGWIRRDPVPGDRRLHALQPTGSGLALLETAKRAVNAHELRLMGGLGDGLRAALDRAARQIIGAAGRQGKREDHE